MPKCIRLNDVPMPKEMVIFSVDPGQKNFACRLETRKVVSGKVKIEPLMFFRKKLSKTVLQDISAFFDEHDYLLSLATICIVEYQLTMNYFMLRISQHVESYFMTKYPKVAIFEISSKMKPAKDVCVPKALEILKKGGDLISYNFLSELSQNYENCKGKEAKSAFKCDDLADTVGQIEAFFEYLASGQEIPLGPVATFGKSKSKKKIARAKK